MTFFDLREQRQRKFMAARNDSNCVEIRGRPRYGSVKKKHNVNNDLWIVGAGFSVKKKKSPPSCTSLPEESNYSLQIAR